jgi:hypothetical protein
VKGARQQAESSFTDFAGGNLPHSIEAEQGLLGAILINNEAYGVVSRLVLPEDLFEPIHQKIYALTGDLISADKLATPVTLKNYLTADLDIAGMSLDRYLARLCAEATTVINAPDYAKSTGADPGRRKAAGRARGARTFTATSAPAAAPIPVGPGEVDRALKQGRAAEPEEWRHRR